MADETDDVVERMRRAIAGSSDARRTTYAPPDTSARDIAAFMEMDPPEETSPASTTERSTGGGGGREEGRIKSFLKKHGKLLGIIGGATVGLAAILLTVNMIFSSPKADRFINDNQILIECAVESGMSAEEAVNLLLTQSPGLSLDEKLALIMVNLDKDKGEAMLHLSQLTATAGNEAGKNNTPSTNSPNTPAPTGSGSTEEAEQTIHTYKIEFRKGERAPTQIPSHYQSGLMLSDPSYRFDLPILGAVPSSKREGDWYVYNPQTGKNEVVYGYEDLARIFPNGYDRTIVISSGEAYQAPLEITGGGAEKEN